MCCFWDRPLYYEAAAFSVLRVSIMAALMLIGAGQTFRRRNNLAEPSRRHELMGPFEIREIAGLESVRLSCQYNWRDRQRLN